MDNSVPEQTDNSSSKKSDDTDKKNSAESEQVEDNVEEKRSDREASGPGATQEDTQKASGDRDKQEEPLDQQANAEDEIPSNSAENGLPDTADETQDDEEDLSIDLSHPEKMSGKDRDKVYEHGAELDKRGKKTLALKCYLACLTGLQEDSDFNFLPQCLHNVADIYYGKEEFEKAVQFIQAEKMFYETSLINISGLQRKIENDRKKQSGENADTTVPDEPAEAAQASEYESLARLCLEKNQAQLALEYQAKATKLRQQIYGDDHPLTSQSLDFFTVLYGEVGKQQYSESLKKYADKIPTHTGEGEPENQEEEKPELRQRKPAQDETDTEKDVQKDGKEQVQFSEPPETAQSVQRKEEWMSQVFLVMLFIVCATILGVMIFISYCELSDSITCAKVRAEVHYLYMRMKYYYYQYTAVPQETEKFG